MNTKPHIHIVWLKRDLRLHDNEAIFNALKTGKRVLIFYSFEPILMNDSHYSQRHWDFIKESLVDLNNELATYNSKVLVVQSDIIAVVNQLLNTYKITDIFSHQETGILTTFERDKTFKRFCKNNLIQWHENINNLNSFFQGRYENYMFHISKPELGRKSCSRISPYIAWGNLSIREVYHQAYKLKKHAKHKKALEAFMSRLRWQTHFIQKFEMEHIMEEASVNKGFHKLKKNISEDYQIAWKTGQTGYPLVDACMRCLNETGYLNFRMRALVVSFFTHNLWQPWQEATRHLSQMFLDFEPGIHFPQLQMQAGETGINMLRIYNPIKNSLEHDPDAAFIKKWVPELEALDTPFAHQPYLMTSMEQQFYNFKLGEDYPYPIVDIEATRKKAGDTLWNMRNNKKVIEESKRILKKHTFKRTSAFSWGLLVNSSRF